MLSTEVKEGIWTDYSRESFIQNKTLTLSNSHASVLIAFLALFVGLVGTRCWTIVAFILHQARASPKPRNVLHHQSQGVLRNGGSDIGSFLDLVRLAWAWRRNAQSRAWIIFLLMIAIINFLGFSVAGIFSSRVARTGGTNFVLAKPTDCGFVVYDDNTQQTAAIRGSYLDTMDAQAYSRNCYARSTTSKDCRFFPKPSLPYQIDRNAHCPFRDNLCNTSHTSVISFDTGLIDTIDLGINAPLRKRISYRIVNTCSHLKIHNHKRIVKGRQLSQLEPSIYNVKYDPDDWYAVVYLGPQAYNNKILSNYTYLYNGHAAIDRVGYTLSARSAMASYPNIWTPVEALNRTDADVHVVFLALNSITYAVQVDDSVFGAHTMDPEGPTTFYPDHDVSAIGCTKQYQFCDANDTNSCTDLSGFNIVESQLEKLTFNRYQISTAYRILLTTYGNVANTVPGILGASALRAQEHVNNQDFQSGGLPNNQWQIEAQGWFETELARLQFATVQFVSHSALLPGSHIKPPFTPQLRHQCANLRVRNTSSYRSFSVAGIIILLALGGQIILLSLFVCPLVGLLQKWSGMGIHGYYAFITDHYFQLQRLVLQNTGYGTWTRETSFVPVTKEEEILSVQYEAYGDHLQLLPQDAPIEDGKGY